MPLRQAIVYLRLHFLGSDESDAICLDPRLVYSVTGLRKNSGNKRKLPLTTGSLVLRPAIPRFGLGRYLLILHKFEEYIIFTRTDQLFTVLEIHAIVQYKCTLN